jgi:adenylate cyclase class 2
MTEMEIKASLGDMEQAHFDEVTARLGFRQTDVCVEEDVYYNGIGRNFRMTDEALRLRVHMQNGRTEAAVTYKGAKQNTRSQTRLELETEVADAKTMRAILERLGFCAAISVRKIRRTLQCGQITICLDEVDDLGRYLALETLAQDEYGRAENKRRIDGLLRLLDELGVPRGRLERRSYLELLMARAMLRKSDQGI